MTNHHIIIYPFKGQVINPIPSLEQKWWYPDC